MRKKSQTEIEIPRIGIKGKSFLSLFYRLLFLVSSFACLFFDSILVSSVLVVYQINLK